MSRTPAELGGDLGGIDGVSTIMTEAVSDVRDQVISGRLLGVKAVDAREDPMDDLQVRVTLARGHIVGLSDPPSLDHRNPLANSLG